MYLPVSEDELRQLRAELVTDDRTSCTSSLATTVSVGLTEDTDELYLGAEANSFFGHIKKNIVHLSAPEAAEKSNNRLSKGGYLLAMKELYNSLESVHTHRTCSSMTKISNVSDLMQAREVNASELLAGVGFVNNSEDLYRREVLSRFEPSPLLTEEDNKFLHPKVDIPDSTLTDDRPYLLQFDEMRKSIRKTQEWLSQQHDNDSLNGKGDPNKVTSTGVEPKKANLSKAIRARRKFTKSRQSSFDLLPKLKEEDPHEGEPFSSQQQSKQLAALLSATIRKNFKHDDDETIAEIPPNLAPNTIEQPRMTDIESTNQDSSMISSTKPYDETQGSNFSTATDLRKSYLPKPPSVRMESFEMEEIYSNNGETSDSGRLRLSTSTETMAGDAYHHPSHEREVFQQLPDDDQSDDSETSSGFDEDDVNTTSQPQTLSTSTLRKVKPHTVVESLQINPISSSTDLPIKPATRYVFDIDQVNEDAVNQNGSTNCNDNNNNKVKKHKEQYTKNSIYTTSSKSPEVQCDLVKSPPLQTCTKHLQFVAVTPAGGDDDSVNKQGILTKSSDRYPKASDPQNIAAENAIRNPKSLKFFSNSNQEYDSSNINASDS